MVAENGDSNGRERPGAAIVVASVDEALRKRHSHWQL